MVQFILIETIQFTRDVYIDFNQWF